MLLFPLCWTITQLSWAMIDGANVLKRGQFDGQSNWEWAMRTLLHGVDYILRCHVEPDKLVVIVRTYSCACCYL